VTNLLFAALLLPATLAMAQNAQLEPKTELLWPNGAPGALGTEDRDRPEITIFQPSNKHTDATAVLICPGGGYGALAMNHEGRQIANWLNSYGIVAVVLKYRLGPRYHHPTEMHDAQQAIRVIRSRATELGVAPDRIGAWGFSAGGHLVATIGTHFDSGMPGASDLIARQSSRPDFLILAYPVISFTTPYTHKGSLKNLLGANPDPALVQNLSNELQVTAQTPPTFLFHTNADTGVPAENSVLFYLALRKAGVPAELHVFEKGPHGVGLGNSDAALSGWPVALANWLRTRGLLK
jgi:acetyl esterase/lipase